MDQTFLINSPAPQLIEKHARCYFPVNPYLIQHPYIAEIQGTLAKSMKTGRYVICSDKTAYSCSQTFGKEYDIVNSQQFARDNTIEY